MLPLSTGIEKFILNTIQNLKGVRSTITIAFQPVVNGSEYRGVVSRLSKTWNGLLQQYDSAHHVFAPLITPSPHPAYRSVI